MSGDPDVFTIPALRALPATATPATSATPSGAVAPVAADRDTATPATASAEGQSVAGVAHVAVAARADKQFRDPAFRRVIIAARDAAHLEDWRAALVLERLHLCGNCSSYTFGQDPAGAGTCALHGDGLLAFAMPFDCQDFQASATPAAPGYLPT